MKKKILGIFVCMLLIATAIPVVGTLDEKTTTSTGGIELVPVVDFKSIKGGLLGISVLLMNFGEGTAHDITWSMTVSGGFLFFPRNANGEIDLLEPGEELPISIWPMLGLGQSTVYFDCKYTIILDSSRSEVEVGVKQEWRDLGFAILHTFPEGAQPIKDWMEIESYSYFNETDDKGVVLNFEGINNMHNVRCFTSDFRDILFLASCCFESGVGYLTENWITKDIVESGEAYWEVELVNGM